MKTLYIAATCVLLAAPAAHAGSLIDSFLGGGGGGLSIGDCNTDHCSFSVGRQKHVVRRSDFGSAAATGMEVGEKVMGGAKSQLKARAKGLDHLGLRADRAVEGSSPPSIAPTTGRPRAAMTRRHPGRTP